VSLAQPLQADAAEGLPPDPRRQAVRDLAVILLFGILCFSVHLWRGFTVDEYATWSRTRLPFEELVQDRLKNGHFPAYFVLVQAWSHLAGEAEFVFRLPSVAFGLLGLVALWLLARDLAGRRAALVAGAIYPLHQVVIWCSQNARPWAGVLGFSILAALGLVRYWLTGRRRWLLVVSLSVVMGFSFAAAFAMTVAAFSVAMLISVPRAPRPAGWSLTALLAPLVLLAVPAVTLAQTQQKYDHDRGPFAFNLFRGVNGLADVILGDYKIWTGEWVRYVALGLFVWLGWHAWQVLRVRDVHLARLPTRALIFSWLLLPWICLMVGAAVTRTSMLSNERYFVPLLGAIVVVLAVGLDRVIERARNPLQRWLPPAGVFILLALTAVHYWRTDGDGPRLLVREWLRTEPPRAIVGHVGPLAYEFRSQPAPLMITAYGRQPDEVRNILRRVAQAGPVWLFVYNNKKDPLDALLNGPVEGLVPTQRIKIRDARATLFVRTAQNP
jgi:4-amino-4-deoxy-L-arabinose transferase-like glycosyltransferase